MQAPSVLRRGGHALAYERIAGSSPEIVFLSGYGSDMTGTKASYLAERCRETGQAFTRFDYSGHGASTGRFVDGTIGSWTRDTIAIIDQIVQGPCLLVGSSMGGWIMLLAALARPERLHGLVGVAPAPDFDVREIAPRITAEQSRQLEERGYFEAWSDYEDPLLVSKALLDDAKAHHLLRGPIEIHCPVHLLQGQLDAEVRWETALDLAAALSSTRVTVEFLKDGDHRLSRPEDLKRLWAAIQRVAASQSEAAPAA